MSTRGRDRLTGRECSVEAVFADKVRVLFDGTDEPQEIPRAWFQPLSEWLVYHTHGGVNPLPVTAADVRHAVAKVILAGYPLEHLTGMSCNADRGRFESADSLLEEYRREVKGDVRDTEAEPGAGPPGG